MTYEEFLAWGEESQQMEWVDGEVIVFMPPTILHQRIIGFLHTLLSVYARLFHLGEVLPAPVEMRARPDGPAREPDLLFVADEHRDRLTPERLAGPADLVIEIISESSMSRDRADKFYEYQEAGVPEYWLFDPRPGKERADFWRLNAQGKYDPLTPDAEGRYFSTVLPGFWFRPDWLWQNPLPDPMVVLKEIDPEAFRAWLLAKNAQPSEGS